MIDAFEFGRLGPKAQREALASMTAAQAINLLAELVRLRQEAARKGLGLGLGSWLTKAIGSVGKVVSKIPGASVIAGAIPGVGPILAQIIDAAGNTQNIQFVPQGIASPLVAPPQTQPQTAPQTAPQKPGGGFKLNTRNLAIIGLAIVGVTLAMRRAR